VKVTEIIYERSFKVAHFPPEDNPKLKGAGERTVYAKLPVNQPPGGGGFRVKRQTPVVKGTTVKSLDAGDRVYFTTPARLFKAADIGQKGVSYYARVGIRSTMVKDSIGYVPISVLEKPTRIEGRVATGAQGQEQVFEFLQQTYGDKHTIEHTGGAIIGSKAGDLKVTIDGERMQIEIKNASSPKAPMTLYDKTVRRGKFTQDIDDIIRAITGNSSMSMEKYIDMKRRKDRTIGYPGDKGVTAKSGSFPRVLISQDDPAMQIAYKAIIRHFAMGDDTHFAINHGSGAATIYHTGHGPNPINAPVFPVPTTLLLDTYGGAYRGGMRMGVKIKL
jgi:hypothetical protein